MVLSGGKIAADTASRKGGITIVAYKIPLRSLEYPPFSGCSTFPKPDGGFLYPQRINPFAFRLNVRLAGWRKRRFGKGERLR
jgi:hypothetical protein